MTDLWMFQKTPTPVRCPRDGTALLVTRPGTQLVCEKCSYYERTDVQLTVKVRRKT